MPESLTFNGFSEPEENWYRLPNDWFDIWHVIRNEHGSRFAPMLKMTEYILKHTWGAGRFNGQVQLSADEIRLGRRRKKSDRFDKGTNISANSVQNAGRALVEFGLLEIEQDQVDLARRLRTYRPHIHEKLEEQASEPFTGFSTPTQNYFKVPKAWTDITTNITSAATILTVEYLFRHAWGFNNKEGVWLSADEIAEGRQYSDGFRYDAGTGFDVSSIHRALKEALALGLIVWIEKYEAGITTRLFNLKFKEMHASEIGEYLGLEKEDAIQTSGTIEVVSDANDDNLICAIEEPNSTHEVVNCINDAVSGTDDERSDREHTLKNTHPKHVMKTPSPKGTKKTKRKRHSPKNAGDDDVPKLPDDLIEILSEIGWSDSLLPIQQLYRKKPALVREWAKYTQGKTGLNNRAGYFRKRLFSGEKPPATKVPDCEDRNRYVSGKYAEYFD
ncbi:MAG: hypothetical protein ISR58_17885 [Anaerolineales bacterium]|nr:hypothetical protein [Anaerolineales bacterium]